jgi:uncharacterized membrane protein
MPGRKRTFVVEIQNDGPGTDDFTIVGSENIDPFTVRYFDGATEISDAVKNGLYTTNELMPGESRSIRMKVKAKARAMPGTIAKFRLQAISNANSLLQDEVKARVQVVQ